MIPMFQEMTAVQWLFFTLLLSIFFAVAGKLLIDVLNYRQAREQLSITKLMQKNISVRTDDTNRRVAALETKLEHKGEEIKQAIHTAVGDASAHDLPSVDTDR